MAEPGVVSGARGSAERRLAVAWRGCRDLVGDWARTLPLERMVLRLLAGPCWRMGLFDEGRRCADEAPFLKPLSHAPFPHEVQSTLPPLPGALPHHPAPPRNKPSPRPAQRRERR